MRILIIGLIILALSVAGISTYLIQNFSTPEAIQALEEKAEPIKTQVLVANKPLNPGDFLNSNNMDWRPWPEESLSEFYASVEKDDQKEEKFKELVDSVVRHPIQAGEPVLMSKIFKSDGPGFMAGMLDRGMRAVSVPVTEDTGVAGFILPGDRVDILIVHGKGKDAIRKLTPKRRVETENSEIKPLNVLDAMTETILQDIQVLAVDQVVGKPEGNSLPGKTVTLQLTPKQAEILITGRAMGQIALVLRDLGARDHASETKPGTFTTDVQISPFMKALNNRLLLSEAKKKAKRAGESAAKAAQKNAVLSEAREQPKKEITKNPQITRKPSAKKQVIEIYRGNAAKVEEIKVK